MKEVASEGEPATSLRDRCRTHFRLSLLALLAATTASPIVKALLLSREPWTKDGLGPVLAALWLFNLPMLMVCVLAARSVPLSRSWRWTFATLAIADGALLVLSILVW